MSTKSPIETRLLTNEDFPEYVAMMKLAYPGIDFPQNNDEFIKRLQFIQSTNDKVDYYGMFDKGGMVACYRDHDYLMNISGAMVKAAGIGGVQVALERKKEKIALKLVRDYLEASKEKGAFISLLYAFRPDFYRKMGYGYGTVMNRYEIDPVKIPSSADKKSVRLLTNSDMKELCSFYNDMTKKKNGLIMKSPQEFESLLGKGSVFAASYSSEGMDAYVRFTFSKAHSRNFVINDLVVEEMLYSSSSGLSALMSFLSSQADQIRRIVFLSQEEDLFYLFGDPRNTSGNLWPSVYHEVSQTSVGIMYRVIDPGKLIEASEGRKYPCIDLSVRFKLTDTLIRGNEEPFTVKFSCGKAYLSDVKEADASVEMDIAEFSSLFMGSVSLSTLVKLGLAKIDNESLLNDISTVTRADKPICYSNF